jgi:hypothetical protein
MIDLLQPSATKFVVRPFEIKHLFDLAIKLYRSNFAVLFLCQAMVQLPLSLLTLGPTIKMLDMANQLSDPRIASEGPDSFLLDNLDALMLMGFTFLGAMAYQLLITPIGNVATAYAAKESLLGRLVGFGEAVSFALTRYWQTQVALATFFLPLLGLAVLTLIPVVLLTGAGEEMAVIGFSLVGLLLIMAGMGATFLMWFRFFPALMGIVQSAEDPPLGGVFNQGLHYLRRSWELSKGYFGRVLGLSLAMFFAIYLVNRGVVESIQLLAIVIQALARGQNAGAELMNVAMGPADPLVTGITMVAASVTSLVFPPLLMCYLTLMYYDLRCRKEAFDLKRELGMGQV